MRCGTAWARTARWRAGAARNSRCCCRTCRCRTRALCERLRARVEAIDCSAYAPGWTLTASAGVTERTGVVHHERLVGRADALLYEAKRAGRNRICG